VYYFYLVAVSDLVAVGDLVAVSDTAHTRHNTEDIVIYCENTQVELG
jgi:hypothetical protein